MKEAYIFIFDITSSTVYLDDLHEQNSVNLYQQLIDEYYLFFKKNKAIRYEVYKFLGDGFIIIFNKDETIEDIFLIIFKLAAFSEILLETFIKNNISKSRNIIPRIGITAGLDYGIIHPIINKTTEYCGRPINFASRLQGSLTGKEHVYKMLMSLSIYRKINDYLIQKACIERERSFKNLSNENTIRCFEIDMLSFKNITIDNFRNKTLRLEKEMENEEKIEKYESVFKKMKGYEPFFKKNKHTYNYK